MSALRIILTVIYVILAVVISAVVLIQEGKSQGLGSASGGMDRHWKKNKGRTMEGALEKFTKYGAIVFFILTIVINVLLERQGL